MSTLFQIRCIQFDPVPLTQASDSDALLLLGDACYSLPQWQQAVQASGHSPTLYVRQSDLTQRGLKLTDSGAPHANQAGDQSAVQVISDSQWVALTLAYTRTISWG